MSPIYGINGAALWLHADLLTSLAKTAGETTVALGDIASGNQIYRWFDDSGHVNAANHTAIQLTTTYQPTFWNDGSGLNGMPFVCFNAPGLTPSTGTIVGAALNIPDAAPGFLEVLDGQGAGGPGAGKGSYTVLMLVRQRTYNGSGSSYSALSAIRNGNSQFLNFNRSPASTAGGQIKRFNSTVAGDFPQNQPLAFALTFSCNGTANQGTETLYVNDASAPVAVSTVGRPALVAPYNTWTIGAETTVGGKCFTNGEVYEILAFERDLNNAEIATIFAAWNSKYALALGTSVGPLTAGVASASSVTQTTQTVSATAPVGGTAPYTYQWYRSTTPGVLGAPIAGATALVRNETGLTAQTNYYYTLRVTDSLGATADTAQLYAPTHGTFAVRIGFIGNSQMTQEPGGETIPQAFARLFFQAYPGADPIVTNLAVSGQEARMVAQTNGGGNLLAGYLTTLGTAGVTHCFVLHGGNDATQQGLGTPGYTTADYIEDMTDIVTRLAAAGITPIVCETPYRSSNPSSDAVVQIYNPLLPGICNGTTILMGDQAVYEEWFANPALYLRDGLHPTATGVVRWAQLLLAVTPLSMLPPATGFTWTGPAGGPTGVAAGPFTATPVGGKFTGTVTPNDAGGGGTWTPASRTFVGSVTPQTFTYTPAGASGTRSLSLVSSPILPAPPTLNFDTPDTTGPSFVSATVNAAGDSLRVVWSENVNPATAVAGVTLSGGYTLGNGTRVGSPGNTVDFPITNGPVPMGTALTAGYNPTPGNLVDLAGNEQASTSGFVVDNLSTYTSDVTPPTIVSAVVDVTGTELTVTLSENCNPPTGAVGFSIGGVTLGSGVRTASPGNVYTFPILSVPIAAGVGLTLAYDQGAGNVLDLAGNEIASVSGVVVTNLVTAPPTVTGLPIPIIRIRVPELTAPITLILEGS